MHSIKVQFPDINFQFRNVENLTSLASKIGQVFEVKSFDSHVKRPTGPVITVEVADVSKLPGCILLPSLDLKEAIDATMPQRILYLGLLNRCRRCRKFGHYARRCPKWCMGWQKS